MYGTLIDGIKANNMQSIIRFFDVVQNMESYGELGECQEALQQIWDYLTKDGKFKEEMVQKFWNISSALITKGEQYTKLRAWIISHGTDLIKVFLGYVPKEHKERNRTERAAISVLLNFSENDDLRPLMNSGGVVEKMMVHAKDSLTAGLTVANLVASLPDSMNDKLVFQSSMIEKVISTFDLSLTGTPDMSDGDAAVWWPEEVCLSVVNLCQNDKNKVALVKAGVVPRLVRVLKQEDMPKLESASPIMQRERAAKAIWQLAFVEENKKPIIEAGAIAALEAVRDSTDPEMSDANTYKQAVGALWQLGYRPKEEKEPEVAAIAGGQEWQHVMISYNWAAQKAIVQLKMALEAKGYKVWLDLDSMQGSTLEAMAKAVESSHVFCMAMSRKYKESPNCRAEAEYAFNLRKPIIPVLVEANYRPDGWLGAILGTKLYFDFSPSMKLTGGDLEIDDSQFGKVVPSVVKELASQLPKGVNAGSPSTTVSTSMLTTVASSSPTLSHVGWDTGAVGAWLEKIGLKIYAKQFLKENMNGEALEELRKIRLDDPTAFLRICEKSLKIGSVGHSLIFSKQLRALGN